MKRLNKLFSIVAALVVLFSATACGGETGFQLQHFNGMSVEKYDTDLLWRNSSEIANDGGGDGSALWVSEEQDPENGGWFYLYSTKVDGQTSTEDGLNPGPETGPAAYRAFVLVSRSKDLIDWEPCGAVDDLFALKVPMDSWILSNMYAPECIYDPETDKYFLYFSAMSKKNTEELSAAGAQYSWSASGNDRFYLGVAVSETPYGPFELVSSENYYGDENATNPNGRVLNAINPTMMVDEECDAMFTTPEFLAQYVCKKCDHVYDGVGAPSSEAVCPSCSLSGSYILRDEIFSIIDAHPFRDENGDLYFYFVRHMSNKNYGGHNVWGFKMKDMVTPDYSTISCLFRGTCTSQFNNTIMLGNPDTATIGKKFVRNEYRGQTQNDPTCPRHLGRSWKSYTTYADGTESTDGNNEANLVEAPNMLTTKDKDGRTVYVMSYSPFGVDNAQGNYDCKAAYSYSPLEGYIKPNPEQGAVILGGDAKNNFMSNLGHVSFVKANGETWVVHWERQTPFGGLDQGRLYALASVGYQYVESTGIYMPVANGATTSLQPKTSIATGYRNVAPEATVSATNVKNNSEKYLTDGTWVTRAVWSDREFIANGETKITLTFNSPVTVRGVFVFNSYQDERAFKRVSKIEFTLAEKPTWHIGDEATCYIKNLPYNVQDYLDPEYGLQPGSAAIATFNEIKVSKITISLNKSDLYMGGNEIRVSEIFVMGK